MSERSASGTPLLAVIGVQVTTTYTTRDDLEHYMCVVLYARHGDVLVLQVQGE
jgi:hypothetical protein